MRSIPKSAVAGVERMIAEGRVKFGTRRPPGEIGQHFRNFDVASVNVPIPPSVNNLFPTGKSGKRFKSPEYTAWIKEALPILETMRAAEVYPVKVTLTIEQKLHGGSDADNRIKPILDAMKKAGVIVDDNCKHVAEVSIRYRPTADGCGVRVEMEAVLS